jgi:hypothetical protein
MECSYELQQVSPSIRRHLCSRLTLRSELAAAFESVWGFQGGAGCCGLSGGRLPAIARHQVTGVLALGLRQVAKHTPIQ